jgi:hypothetical protein
MEVLCCEWNNDDDHDLNQAVETIVSLQPDGTQMPALKVEKKSFLIRRKWTRLAEEEKTVVEDVGESSFFKSVANPVRGGFILQDRLKGMRLEHGIRIAVAVAQKSIIFHV